MRQSRWLAAAAVSAIVAGAPVLGAPELAGLSYPDLDHLTDDVAELIRERRAAFDRLFAAGEVPTDQAVAALGSLGGLYYLYDLADLARVCFAEAERLDPDNFRWPYLRGIVEIGEGNFERAEPMFERALELEPDDPTTQIRLGDVRLKLQRLDEAAEDYLRALSIDDSRAAAHYGLGRIASARGEHEVAIDRFERAIELQPGATSIHYQVGMAYRAAGDLQAAKEHLVKNSVGRLRVEDAVVDSLAAEVISRQKAFSAGVDALRQGDLEKAERLLLRAEEEKPNDPLVPYNLALLYLKRDQKDRAYEALLRSVEANPDFRNGHFNLGELAAQAGDYEEAEFRFRRVHEIDPEDIEAHLQWTYALGRLGKTDSAIRELTTIIEISPQNTGALLRLGALKIHSAPAEARAYLDRVLTGDPAIQERVEALVLLGGLDETEGRRSQAVTHVRQAVELDPGNSELVLRLATLEARAGELAQAAETFDRAIELDPAALEAHFGRAMALILGEDYRRARQSLEESLSAAASTPPGTLLPLRHLYARLLASCPLDEVRDGEMGLKIAMEVFRSQQSIEHAETVAMALAEVGRFSQAVEWQRRVVEQTGGGGQAAARRARLELYERGEPCRAPWKSG